MSVVEGLAGVRVYEDSLAIDPQIPTPWKSYSFQIRYQNQPLAVAVSQQKVMVTNLGSAPLTCDLVGAAITIEAGAMHEAVLNKACI
jgi:maltose phosphorylase